MSQKSEVTIRTHITTQLFVVLFDCNVLLHVQNNGDSDYQVISPWPELHDVNASSF